MNPLSPAQENAHAAFCGGNNIIITGPAASGKSYLLRALQRRYSNQRDLWCYTVDNPNDPLPIPRAGAQVVVNAGPRASMQQALQMAQYYNAIIVSL